MAKFQILLVLSLMLGIQSCGPTVVYQQNHELSKPWTYEEEVIFEFEIKDSLQKYNLMLSVVHSPDFSFQNVYTNVKTRFPNGKEFSDPLSIELANKMGSWLSSCSGDQCILHLRIRENINFTDIGKYQITFTQNTREKALEGIKSLSLSLVEVENK